jgi:hypothetical protein
MIREWLPPGFTAEYALFWLTATALVWLTATRWRHLREREERTLVAISLLMLALAVRASRNIVPFGLMAAPAISVLLWHRGKQAGRAVAPEQTAGAALRILIFAVSLAAAVFVVQRRWTAAPPPADWAPMSREAISAIRACPGPIYNRYGSGGFIIWFVPEQKVFLDSRQDPYPDRLLREQREATTPATLRDLLTRYQVRCAVLEPGAAEVRALGGLGWTESYGDGQWAVMTAPGIAER